MMMAAPAATRSFVMAGTSRLNSASTGLLLRRPRCCVSLNHARRNLSTSSTTAAAAAGASGRPASAAAADATLYQRTSNRGPVSWPSLFLVGVAALSAVSYYRIEREGRLEQALGKIVSSESDNGWTPRPDYLAKRKFIQTKYGWFPREDGFGARECVV
jgi:hypothetical protein